MSFYFNFSGNKTFVSGTVSVDGFKLTTSPSNGYVLTSDGAGVGTWQASSGGAGSGVSATDPGYLRTSLNNFKSLNTFVSGGYGDILPSITAGQNARLQKLRIINNATSGITYDLDVVTNGVTGAFERAYTLSPKSIRDYTNIVIENGGTIRAQANVSSGVYAQVSYVEEVSTLFSGKVISLAGTSTDIIPTVPAGNRVRVWTMYIHNTGASSRVFSIDILDKTAGNNFQLYNNYTIAPKSTVIVEDLNLQTGGNIKGSGSAASEIEATVSYEFRSN